MSRNIFIGLAWPYANGSLHLGHVSSFLGADILARHFRIQGDNVLFISGSDCYGTPIAVEAEQKNSAPAVIAEKYHQEFIDTLQNRLGFSYDLYTKTATEHHKKEVQKLFLVLYEKGYLYLRKENSLFSPYLNRFLPDRFVEGTCPKCNFNAARGDQCDECGSLLDPLELLNPRINSKIFNTKKVSYEEQKLEIRETEHFFLKLSELQQKLESWAEARYQGWRPNATGFTKSFLRAGLHDRAVTRDTDWGIPVPVPGFEGKSIYVWFEAVSGYLTASKLWSEQENDLNTWRNFWCNSESVHYYVHGKDNIPFHTIIWPAILLAEGSLHTPDRIVSSEYLTLEGKQFSKSGGWAVWLPEYLKHFDPEPLRYFLTMYGPETRDADFSWLDFQEKVNGELIGTLGNFIQRTLSLVEREFPSGVKFIHDPTDIEQQEFHSSLRDSFGRIATAIEDMKFREAFKIVLSLAEDGNLFLSKHEPWKLIKNGDRVAAENVLSISTHICAHLAILLAPFLPVVSKEILKSLNFHQNEWRDFFTEDSLYQVSALPTLFKKIESDMISQVRTELFKS